MVPKGNQEMVAAAIRTIFAQPDAEHVHEQFEVIAEMLGRQLPKVEQMLREAHDDLLAFTGFPVAHWKKIWSTNPLERLNKEVKRRTDVVGVFPNPAALLRLAGAVLVEAHDEWQVTAERRYLSERSMALVTEKNTNNQEEVAKPELMTASSEPLTRTVSRNSTTQRDVTLGQRCLDPSGTKFRVSRRLLRNLLNQRSWHRWLRNSRHGGSVRQAPGDVAEEVVDLADHLDEPLEVDRLRDVGVGVQVVARSTSSSASRGGEHDHGDAAQLGVRS